MKVIRFVFFFVLPALSMPLFRSFAQEYKYETGVAIGVSSYLGDANKTELLLSPNIAGGAVYRYNINFHWAARGNLLVGKASGDTQNSGNIFPNNERRNFNRPFAELSGQVEYNFFPFSNKYAYLDTKRYTPYIFAGVGVTLATGDNVFFNANIPFGVGIKYKIKERLNIGLEFSVRKLFGDDFDAPNKSETWNLNAPYNIKSSFFKNNDWYFLSMIHLTWDFGLRRTPCCD